jgi:membrane-anchored mycosin MYCP
MLVCVTVAIGAGVAGRAAAVASAVAILLAAQVGAAAGAFAAPSAPLAGTAGPKPSPSQAAAPVQNCGEQAGDLASPGTAAPWAQQVLGFADAWQFTTGQGENVAVIDSGVSGNQQLSGRVAAEQSLTSTGAGRDCVDHGTGVAGIIAAAPRQHDPFAGVAPGAEILSIKVTDQEGVDAGSLAAGITDAVNDHAQIINVSDQVGNTPELSAAVLFAARRDVVIVAAAGNVDQQTGSTGPFYPAAYASDPATYPNVLSVGAVDQAGGVPDFSRPVRTSVSVVAPGAGVLTIAPGGTFKLQDGTSFAAPFVAGAAALVRASHPKLTAAGVVSRIIATADGGTGAGAGRTGAGMVDPLQAVTALLPAAGQPAAPLPPAARVSIPRNQPPDRFTRLLVACVTGGALGGAGLVVAAAVVIPAGRRRRAAPDGAGHGQPPQDGRGAPP